MTFCCQKIRSGALRLECSKKVSSVSQCKTLIAVFSSEGGTATKGWSSHSRRLRRWWPIGQRRWHARNGRGNRRWGFLKQARFLQDALDTGVVVAKSHCTAVARRSPQKVAQRVHFRFNSLQVQFSFLVPFCWMIYVKNRKNSHIRNERTALPALMKMLGKKREHFSVKSVHKKICFQN